MSPEEFDLRIGQIEGFIRSLTQQCHILDERRHILEPLLKNAEVQEALRRKLDKTPGAGAWNHLAPLLGQDLLRDQARLFLDDDKRSGSLQNLWRKLRADRAIKHHFRDAYGHMFDDLHTGRIRGLPEDVSATFMESFKKDDQSKHLVQFDQRWGRLESSIPELREDPVALKILTFRDKHHAHFEMQKLSEGPAPFDVSKLNLTFDEILSFGDKCQGIVAELGLLLTRTSWDPTDFSKAHAKQGTSLWITLAS